MMIRLSAEAFDKFIEMLNRPSRDMPKLRALMQRPSPFASQENKHAND
jgi:uncharacterized protein (DUF1778 family)